MRSKKPQNHKKDYKKKKKNSPLNLLFDFEAFPFLIQAKKEKNEILIL